MDLSESLKSILEKVSVDSIVWYLIQRTCINQRVTESVQSFIMARTIRIISCDDDSDRVIECVDLLDSITTPVTIYTKEFIYAIIELISASKSGLCFILF